MLYGTAYIDNWGRPALIIQDSDIPDEVDFIQEFTGAKISARMWKKLDLRLDAFETTHLNQI